MTIQGKSVYSGVAIGRLAIYQKSENQVKREKITDTAREIMSGPSNTSRAPLRAHSASAKDEKLEKYNASKG